MNYLCVVVDGVVHITYAADLHDYHLMIEALGERFEGDKSHPHSLMDIMNNSEFEHYRMLLSITSMVQSYEDDVWYGPCLYCGCDSSKPGFEQGSCTCYCHMPIVVTRG
jgi:hypothetical protein